MNFWFCVTTEENWEDCLENNLWGVEPKWKNIIEKVRIGDKLVFHISGMNFGGICTVTGECFFDKSIIWRDAVYPYRINFEPEIVDRPLVKSDAYREFLNENMTHKPSFRISMQKIAEERFEIFKELAERGVLNKSLLNI